MICLVFLVGANTYADTPATLWSSPAGKGGPALVTVSSPVGGSVTQAAEVPLITFRLALVAVNRDPDLEELRNKGVAIGDVTWFPREDFVPQLIDALVTRTSTPTAGAAVSYVSDKESVVGDVVGSLGSSVHMSVSSRPVSKGIPGSIRPDLREGTLTLTLKPLSIDAKGRIQTTINLELAGGETGQRLEYTHTLWLTSDEGAPLAFVLNGPQGQVYALTISGRLTSKPNADGDLIEFASLGAFQERFMSFLGEPKGGSESAPFPDNLRAKIAIGGERLGWRVGINRVLGGAWGLHAATDQSPRQAAATSQIAVYRRLIRHLYFVARTDRHDEPKGDEYAIGLGLTEETHPTPYETLRASYFPVVAIRMPATRGWTRAAPLWEVGVSHDYGAWVSDLSVRRPVWQDVTAEIGIGLEVSESVSLMVQYEYRWNSGQNRWLLGLQLGHRGLETEGRR